MSANITQAEKSWIQKRPNVCGGDACIRDTRIPVWPVIRAHNLGASLVELPTHFVTALTAEDMQTAFEYYQQHQEEIENDIQLNIC